MEIGINQHRPLKLRRRMGLFTRPLRNALAVPLLETFRLISQLLPHAAGLRVGRWIGRLAAWIDASQRRLAGRQMAQAGVAPDPVAANRLSTEVFLNLGMGAVEALHTLRWTTGQINEHIRIEGREFLQPALDQGSGMILVSAHMGNWELLGRVFHATTGRILAAAMASQNNDLVTRWLIRWRETNGRMKLLPGRETLALVRHLRGGGALLMLADQDSTRSRGVFVDFFGRPAYTPAGPAHLARRLGLPLIPAVMVRDPAHPVRHRFLLAEPLRPDPLLTEEADIQRLTQAYTRVLEGWIRQYPSQWVWIHDRWRHNPGQKIRIRSAERRE